MLQSASSLPAPLSWSKANLKSPTRGLCGGRGSRFLHHCLAAEKVLRWLYAITSARACLDECHYRTAALSISQHPLCRSCHTQPPGAAILTCFDEAGWVEGGAGADGAVKLAGVTWLASSRASLRVSDSRMPPWPSRGCQILIPITPLETEGRRPCRSRPGKDSSDSPASQHPLGHWRALWQTAY